jgi:hypothetical protein
MNNRLKAHSVRIGMFLLILLLLLIVAYPLLMPQWQIYRMNQDIQQYLQQRHTSELAQLQAAQKSWQMAELSNYQLEVNYYRQGETCQQIVTVQANQPQQIQVNECDLPAFTVERLFNEVEEVLNTYQQRCPVLFNIVYHQQYGYPEKLRVYLEESLRLQNSWFSPHAAAACESKEDALPSFFVELLPSDADQQPQSLFQIDSREVEETFIQAQ